MDTTEIINAPQEIDLFDLLEGQEFPERTVTLYTNPKAADDYTKIAKSEKPDKALLETAKTKLKDTSLVVTVRGLEPGVVQDMYSTEEDDTTAELGKENELVAKSIVGIVSGNGSTVKGPWDAEKIAKLRRKLPLSEVVKLVTVVTEVNFDSALFDNAVDAGFPG